MDKLFYQFIRKLKEMNIQSMDVVRVREKTASLIRAALIHYAVFSHWDGDYPVFVANYQKGGVREIPYHELLEFIQTMKFVNIRRFKGNQDEREEAQIRMEASFGLAPYDWKDYNCETFANYVQTGKAYSQQSIIISNTVLSLGVGALVTLVARGGKAIGAILLLAVILIAFIFFQTHRSDGQIIPAPSY